MEQLTVRAATTPSSNNYGSGAKPFKLNICVRDASDRKQRNAWRASRLLNRHASAHRGAEVRRAVLVPREPLRVHLAALQRPTFEVIIRPRSGCARSFSRRSTAADP